MEFHSYAFKRISAILKLFPYFSTSVTPPPRSFNINGRWITWDTVTAVIPPSVRVYNIGSGIRNSSRIYVSIHTHKRTTVIRKAGVTASLANEADLCLAHAELSDISQTLSPRYLIVGQSSSRGNQFPIFLTSSKEHDRSTVCLKWGIMTFAIRAMMVGI